MTMARFLTTSLLLAFLVQLQSEVEGNEHRVHNIMLYPEKHSWCKLTPITQVITHLGCKAQEIQNHVCVGACFSFSVPRTVPETPGDDKLYYCDSCQPMNVTWTNVILECSDTSQPRIGKMVEIIWDCSCRSCSGKSGNESAATQSSVTAAIVDRKGGIGGVSGSGDANVDGVSKLRVSSSEETLDEDDEEDDDEGAEEELDDEEEEEATGLLRPIPHTQVIIHKTVTKDKMMSAEEGPAANLIPDTPISEREQILKRMKEKNPEQLKVLGEHEDDDDDEEEEEEEEDGLQGSTPRTR